jgi:putative CocE/NonD family hydrolase
VPIYNDGGWYDIFSYGNIRNFLYLQNFGVPGAKGKQRLSMGPYGHGPLSGELAYPSLADDAAQSKIEELRWFSYWLKGEANGIDDEPPVRYYMMASAREGAFSALNGWKRAEHWPPPNLPTRYYLKSDRTLDTAATSYPEKTSISYQFDPKNPVKTVGGANLLLDRGPADQRAIADREDYLRFETPPLTSAVAIAGAVSVELFVTSDGPDTDFMAKLVDVYPDGYEAIILDAPIRVRYRNGRRAADVKFMQPGKPEKITIDLWQTAITFEKNQKIDLHIS